MFQTCFSHRNSHWTIGFRCRQVASRNFRNGFVRVCRFCKTKARSATRGPEDHVVFGRAFRIELLIAKLCCWVGVVTLCRVRPVYLSRITLGFIRGQLAEHGRAPTCPVRCATISVFAQSFCAQLLQPARKVQLAVSVHPALLVQRHDSQRWSD